MISLVVLIMLICVVLLQVPIHFGIISLAAVPLVRPGPRQGLLAAHQRPDLDPDH